MKYYAVKKVFVKIFTSFLRFARAFQGFLIHSDPLGCIRKQLEAFGRFRKFLRFFGFLSRFSTFPDVIFTKDFSRHNKDDDTKERKKERRKNVAETV